MEAAAPRGPPHNGTGEEDRDELGWRGEERRKRDRDDGGKGLRAQTSTEQRAGGEEGRTGAEGEEGGTGGARAAHFRQPGGGSGAEGSVLLPTLQTHSTAYRDVQA